MSLRRIWSRAVRAALLSALAIALMDAPSAHAAVAEISSFDITVAIDQVEPADCFDGTMHVTGTERIVGKRVDLGDNNFRLHGTLTDAIDVAFSNGLTGVWTTAEHFSFSIRGEDGNVTNVHRDTTMVYDSSGQFIGTVSFRVVEHFTIVDGVVRVDLVHPTLTCDL